ncbi:MAG: class IV adenylate cyclase [Anaerolineae bacterium]|nr:class IV adenylate cyclase [Chloroflexota bacterium]MBP6298153.1 class IV adenylate cyclase [Anaerolineae bacterium]
MAEHNIETEVKLWVDDLVGVEAKLVSLGAELHAPRVFERNSRYDHTDGSLTRRGIVLRLRHDNRARLTYKESGTLLDGIMSRFEAEVEISDFDTMALILERLGFVFTFAYEKYRTTYLLSGSEVTLDELPFGTFVEIEGTHQTIQSSLSALGLNEAVRVKMSYAGAFSVLRDQYGLPFTDATFENFEGIVLSPGIKDLLK